MMMVTLLIAMEQQSAIVTIEHKKLRERVTLIGNENARTHFDGITTGHFPLRHDFNRLKIRWLDAGGSRISQNLRTSSNKQYQQGQSNTMHLPGISPAQSNLDFCEHR